MPPPAPQPGVIPLRPLGTGDVINGAFGTFRRYWKPLIGVMAVVLGIGILLVAATLAISYAALHDRFSAVFDLPPGQDPEGSDVAALFLSFVPAGVVLLVVMTVAAAMFSALCPALIQKAVLGLPTSFGAMWRRSWSRLPSVLAAVLLTALIAGGPALLLYAICIPLIIMTTDPDGSGPPAAIGLLLLGSLLCVPFSVWLVTRFSLAPAAAVCEGLGPVASLRRSSRLIRDGWWRVFGVSLLGQLVAMAIGYAIQMPFGFVGMFAIFPTLPGPDEPSPDPGTLVFGFLVYGAVMLLGGVVSSLFQFSFPQLVISLLYVDQRMRKEDFAATLTAVAFPAPVPGAETGTGAETGAETGAASPSDAAPEQT
ncbi:oxidoreductase [Streptomyces sp. NPDC059957]|uniref:oxidoreductase n=1 Tax=unclassified Streptomyces TaxID=2593676 RepID=UPI003657DB37